MIVILKQTTREEIHIEGRVIPSPEAFEMFSARLTAAAKMLWPEYFKVGPRAPRSERTLKEMLKQAITHNPDRTVAQLSEIVTQIRGRPANTDSLRPQLSRLQKAGEIQSDRSKDGGTVWRIR